MITIPSCLAGVAAPAQLPKIGIMIRFDIEPTELSNGVVTFDVSYEFFVNPPTLSISEVGKLVLNPATRHVRLTSQTGLFEADGDFSDEYRSLKGNAAFRDFQLLDVEGTFVDCPFILNVEE